MTYLMRLSLFAVTTLLTIGCSSVGHRFDSDVEILSRLKVGQTSPEEAVTILGSEPYIKQNLPDGTILWHWQSVVAGAYTGVTDNRLLVLQFVTPDEGNTWVFEKVFHSVNVELPEGMPFGTVAR